MEEINIKLHPAELDFIGTVLSNVSYGSVANANMTHLLAKLRQQANSQKPLDAGAVNSKDAVAN